MILIMGKQSGLMFQYAENHVGLKKQYLSQPLDDCEIFMPLSLVLGWSFIELK